MRELDEDLAERVKQLNVISFARHRRCSVTDTTVNVIQMGRVDRLCSAAACTFMTQAHTNAAMTWSV